MTTEATPELTAIQKIMKALLWDVGVKLTLEAIFASTTWLGSWFWRPIVTFIVTKITDKVWDFMRERMDVCAIRFLNAEHQKEFEDSVVYLRLVAIDKGIDSPEFNKELDIAHKDFAEFVRNIGR